MLARFAWLLLPLLNGGPDEPSEPPEPDEGAWVDPFAPHDDTTDERPLVGHLIPSLVTLEDPALTLRADGLMSPRDHYEGPATVVISGTLVHPFDGEIHDVDVRASFVDLDELGHVWRRLMAPPLELSQEELERRIPLPEFTVQVRLAHSLEPDRPVDIAVGHDYDDVSVDPRALPAYVGGVVAYRLTQPSSDDVRRIVEAGGVADLKALSDWLSDIEHESPPFVEAERRMLVRVAVARLDAMRAPPGHGDFRRLHALLELIRQLAGPEDLEQLLELDRPMRILLMSAALSYQGALVEESALELPVHGLRELPSSSRLLGAYRNALEGIRLDALPELLRLAYDPIDYAKTPDARYQPSAVQAEARALLEPLSPTRVASVLDAADDDTDAQRSILAFYVDIRFAAAIEPMMRWLLLHPDELEHGKAWAKTLGELAVPTLLRYYVDPIAPGERALAREMLASLESDAEQAAVSAMREAGLPIPARADMQATIAAFESHENEITARQASGLVAELFEGERDVLSMSARLRAAERLAHIDPERLYARPEETIALLSDLVLTLDSDSPIESARALDLLEELEFPDRTLADDAVAKVKARLVFARGDYRTGLDVLLERRPELDQDGLRALYGDTIEHWINLSIDNNDYGLAESLIDEASAHLPERSRTWESLARSLFIARYWPALLLGALFGLTTLSTATWLAVRGLQTLVRLAHEAHLRGDRRRRREAHMLRAEAELMRLAASDGTIAADADALRSPFDEDDDDLDEGDADEDDADEDDEGFDDGREGADAPTRQLPDQPTASDAMGPPEDVEDDADHEDDAADDADDADEDDAEDDFDAAFDRELDAIEASGPTSESQHEAPEREPLHDDELLGDHPFPDLEPTDQVAPEFPAFPEFPELSALDDVPDLADVPEFPELPELTG